MDFEVLLFGLAFLAVGCLLIARRHPLGAALGRRLGDTYGDASLLNRNRVDEVREGLRDDAGRALMAAFVALAGAISVVGGALLVVLGVLNP